MHGLKNWKINMIPLSDITDDVIAKWNEICDERKTKCKCGKNAISHMDVCKELTKSGYTKDEITEIINKRFNT